MKSDERAKGTPARRPGARRARSFKPRSMPDISPSHASSLSIQPQDVSLNRMLETLKPHDHLCLIYDSPEEWRACVVPFISIGLKHGEKCCYFADAHTAEQLHGYLQAEGVDVASTEASGQLVILCESEACTKEGSFDPDLMISLLITETEKAIAEGYPALRLTGEMTWVLHGLPDSERLLEYEAKLNREFYPKYPALGICQYDRWKFDPEIIKGVIMTHSLLVRGNHIYRNFYYIPPEEFLNRKRAELEVQHWLNNVAREQQIQETLRESEKKYRTLTEQSLQGLVVVQDFRCVFANAAFAEITGYSVEELLSLPPAKVQAMVHPEDQALVWGRLRDRLAGKKVPSQYEYRSIRKDGTICWLEMFASRIEYDGKPAIQGAVIDITERKQAEETLRQSEERYRTIIEDMDEGYFELDLAGNFTVVNDAHCRNLGYSREELVGMHYGRVVHEEDPEAVRKGLKRMFKTGQPSLGLHRKVLRKDGSIRFAEVSMFPLRSEDRKTTGFRGIGWDITERKRMEGSLRLSEQNFRDSIENSPLGIRIANEGGKTLYANRALLDIYGYSSVEELEAVSRKQRYTPESYDEHRERKEKRKRGEHVPLSYEISIVRSDGQVRCLSVSRREVLWNGEKQFQVVYQDITERKQAEEKYQTIVRTTIDGFWLVDMQGRFLDVNEAYCHLIGYSRDELLNMAITDVEAIEKPEETAKHIRKIKEVGYDRFETRHRHKDGEIVDIEVSVKYLPTDGGRMFVFLRDITERKRAEETLRRSEERYRVLFDTNIDGLCVIDETMKALLVNEAAARIFGFESVEEALEVNPFDFIPPQERERVLENITRGMFENDLKQVNEFRLLNKAGKEVWISAVGAAIEYQDKPAGLISFRDITQHKLMENLLKESEEKYRVLVENAGQAVSVIQDGMIKFGNPKLAEITGFLMEELTSMSAAQLVHPDDRERVLGYRSGRLKGEVVPNIYHLRIIDKKGNIKWIERNVSLITWEGKPAALVLDTDITERKQMVEALRHSEERYRTILDEIEEGYYEVDLAGNFTFVNNATCRQFGYSKEELIGMNYRVYVPKEDVKSMYKAWNKVYRTGEPLKLYPFASIRKDGRQIFLENSVSPLRNNEGKIIGFRSISRDVTERKRAEEERRQLEQKAQVTSRLASVGEMAAGVAHEINNPLTGVIGYAQLLMDGKDIPSDIRRDLAAINEGAQRVASIVKRLLAFSRQVKPERRDVDINELIESTLALRAYHLRVNNIKVTIQLAPDLPETVADPGQLQQVFLNLVVNAETEMKLARGKGKLLIKTEKVDNTIRISFKDNGPGIAKKNLDRIFDPFFTTREVGQGTGLGLSLCHGIVAEHNGKIYAESKLGKGATFIMELPIVTEAKPPKLAESVVEEPEKAAKARILVVDDEQVIRDLVKRVLAGEGYEVETVDNAGDALKKIEGQRYNLVLLDIKMPGMDGVELYKRIQKIAKSLARRVVFITGDIIGVDTEKFLSETKAARIDKPFNAEQLKREVKHALTGGR